MANKKGRTQQPAGADGTQPTRQEQSSQSRPKKTPEQWMQDKLDQAKDPNTQYLKSTTVDTGEFINLLRSSDNLIYQMRMKVGRIFTFEQAQGFYERHRALKEQLNILNAEISKALAWNYTPPRGYNNPFPKNMDAGETKNQSKVVKAE
ncbi:MAG: hypothetical protein JZU65_07925 [Chlorobium sp.]|nr:hypothetical protein [Chlorobium sp.]